KASSPIVHAEDVHRAGGEPVYERRLVKEADAIDVGRHVVVTDRHLAGDFEIYRVNVVQQTRREEAPDVENEPGEDDDSERAGAPARTLRFRYLLPRRCGQSWRHFSKSTGPGGTTP